MRKNASEVNRIRDFVSAQASALVANGDFGLAGDLLTESEKFLHTLDTALSYTEKYEAKKQVAEQAA